MRTLYRFHEYHSGDTYLDVQVYPEYSFPRSSRQRKSKPTSEVQQHLNNENSKRHVYRLANHNFTSHDVALTLTYNNEHLPESFEAAEHELQLYIKRLKRFARKYDLEVKYISVTGEGKREKRLHHHLIISGDIPRHKMVELWQGKGYVDDKTLQFDKFGVEAYSRYIVEHITENRAKGRKTTYHRSRNLSEPVEHISSRRLTKRQIEYMAHHTDFTSAQQLYPDYEFIEPAAGKDIFLNDVNGNYYFLLRDYKPQNLRKGGVRKCRQEKKPRKNTKRSGKRSESSFKSRLRTKSHT